VALRAGQPHDCHGLCRAGRLARHRSAPTRRSGRTGGGSATRELGQLGALTIPQQQAVLDLLHAPGFVDQAPAEVYATLLDQGIYHCSIRTMYRILEQHAEVRETPALSCATPVYQKPELLAEGPQSGSGPGDITKLMGPAKMDVFLSLRHPSTSSADAWSAGVWPMRKVRACFKPLLDEDDCKAPSAIWPAHTARRSRCTDEGQSLPRCCWQILASPARIADRTRPATTRSPKASSRT